MLEERGHHRVCMLLLLSLALGNVCKLSLQGIYVLSHYHRLIVRGFVGGCCFGLLLLLSVHSGTDKTFV